MRRLYQTSTDAPPWTEEAVAGVRPSDGLPAGGWVAASTSCGASDGGSTCLPAGTGRRNPTHQTGGPEGQIGEPSMPKTSTAPAKCQAGTHAIWAATATLSCRLIPDPSDRAARADTAGGSRLCLP